MRALIGAAAFMLALILGCAMWLTTDGERPATPVRGTRPPAPAAQPTTAQLPEVRVSEPSGPAVALPEPAPPREARPLLLTTTTQAGLSANDDAVGLLLYGAVRDASGGTLELDDSWLSLQGPDGRELDVPLLDHTFSAAGLLAGPWKLRLQAEGYRPFSADLDLSADRPVTRFDPLLVPSVRLCVRLTTPAGGPLALPPEMEGVLSVVVTPETPPDRLPAAGDISLTGVGLGGSVVRLDVDAANSGGCATELQVDTDLPAFVSLALHQHVIASQRVSPGAEEVVFTLRPGRLEGALGGLHVRVTDAGGLPLAEAQVLLSDGDERYESAGTDAQGLASLSGQPPGDYYLDVLAPQQGRFSRLVTIAAGEQLELDVQLAAAAHLRGLVLDPLGQPVSAAISVIPLDAAGEDWWTFRRETWESDEQGLFEAGPLPRAQLLLLVVDSGHASRPLVVDARSGDVDGLRLLAEPPVRVEVDCAWPEHLTHRVRIFTADGSPTRTYDWRGGRHGPMPVVPGRYLVQVEDSAAQAFEASGQRMLVTLTP